jgi:hypothetical protein
MRGPMSTLCLLAADANVITPNVCFVNYVFFTQAVRNRWSNYTTDFAPYNSY